MASRLTGTFLIITLSLATALPGCGSGASSSSGGATMDDLATTLDPPQTAAPETPEPVDSAEQQPIEQPIEDADPAFDGTARIQPEAEFQGTEEAYGAESGRRGQTFHADGQGYLYAVFSARFVAQNKITMAQIKKTMDLFEATHSRYPGSHEEFWQAIILEGGVTLPELEEGEEYFYDAEKRELMVRKPAVP